MDVVTLSAAKAYAKTPAGSESIGAAYSDPLRGWFTALGSRDVAPARILCLGDSITEGQGATILGRRWVDRLRDRLRVTFPTTGVTGGAGLLPVRYSGSGSFSAGATITGTQGTPDTSFGFKRYCAILQSAATASFTVTGTSFKVAYVNNSSTDITVKVDGSTVGTISSSGATIAESLSTAFTLSGASQTVQLAANANSNYVEGLYVFNGDESAGIQVYDGGHFGWKASDWTNNATFYAKTGPLIGTFSLVLIALGANDYQAQVATATFTTQLQSIISTLRGQLGSTPGPSIGLLAFPARGDVVSPTVPWSSYLAAMASVASADSLGQVAVIDTGKRMRAPGTDNTLALFDSSKVHPLDKGHGVIADVLVDALTPR